MRTVGENDILVKFFNRDESAIATLRDKYGKACRRIAMSILADERDAEECVNDALLSLWNSIPPAKPENLRAYLFTSVRNCALSAYRKGAADKRGGASADLELMEELAGGAEGDDAIDMALLSDSINRFLAELKREHRIVFIQRYYYGLSYREIARACRLSQKNVSVILSRVRTSLREHLEKEGHTL